MSIHPEAFKFIIPLGMIMLVAMYLSRPLGVLCLVILLFVTFFFRIPAITLNLPKDSISSPAWGKVTSVEKSEDGSTLISIFLSVFNVHVQCAPAALTVTDIQYRKGEFMNAMNADSAHLNEQNTVTFSLQNGEKMEITQIAGLIARRIVCFVQKGQTVQPAQLIGLIRFGSRVNIRLPRSMTPLVRKGQVVEGWNTVLARYTDTAANS